MGVERYFRSWLLAVVFLTVVVSLCPAQEKQEESMLQGEVEESAKATSVDVNGHVVEYSWTREPASVFGADGAGRWTWFMHGQTDQQAKAFDWMPLLTYEEQSKYVSSTRVRTPVMRSELYSLCLPGGTVLKLSQPALKLSELAGHNGQTLRIHIWMCGENTGQGGDLWSSAPQLSLILRDGEGAVKSRSDSQFRTRGSFPWFCYYMDMDIPASFISAGTSESVGGIFMELRNPTSGKAWFCTPSWEFVSEGLTSGRLSPALADPKRGTYAPNPDYDELPMHFLFGLPQAKGLTWRFLEGNRQCFGITTNYDLEAYLKKYQGDWFHVSQVYPHLLYFYNVARGKKACSTLQNGWDERLIRVLKQMQDPDTGLWKVGRYGNLLVTELLVRQCFSPTAQPRKGEKVTPTAWCAVKGETVPRATTLARALLASQRKDANGKLAGWNKYAFQGQDLLEASRDVRLFDMRYSAAAVSILSTLSPLVDQKLQQTIADSVKAAYLFAVSQVMSDTWLWYENETQSNLFLSPYCFLFLERTQALDTKMDMGALPAPQVTADFKDKKCQLTLASVPKKAVSLRIYESFSGKENSSLSDRDLVAVIRTTAAKPASMDPKLLAERFCTAQEREGLRVKLSAREAGTLYLDGVVKRVRKAQELRLGKGRKATLNITVQLRGRNLVLVFSDRYGDLGAATTVSVPR